MRKFRKKPVTIEAVQFSGNNWNEIAKFINTKYKAFCEERYIIIQTLEGNMRADPGDWIIRGVNGEYYPCKPEIFEKTYEEVQE